MQSIEFMNKDTRILTQGEAKDIVESFITGAESLTRTRTSQFEKYEEFVLDGEQYDQSEEPEGDKPKITLNKSDDYINTYLAKIFPKNPDTGAMEVGVKVRGTDKTKKEVYEKEILETYEKNKLPQILLEQGQNFLVGGDAVLYYPKDPLTGSAKIISLDPTRVFLGWSGQRLEQFAFEDEISLADAEKNKKDNWLVSLINTWLLKERESTKRFKKVKRITYWDDQWQIVKIDDACEIRKNEDGFIPVSWIPNNPKAHRHEGRSEVKHIWNLEKEANFRTSDFGDRVRKNTEAVLAVFTERDASTLEATKLKGILPMDKDDRAEFLQLTENKEVLEYVETLTNRMDKKMAINDAVNGQIKSNVSSLAMLYYFTPLLDRISLKRVYWDEAFRELNKAILIYKFNENAARSTPVYHPVMVVDQESKTKNTVLMLQNRLISYAEAIDILRGSENALEELEKIKTEFTELSKIEGFLQIKKETQPQQA